MPRYFFNVTNDQDLHDFEGTELSGPDEARKVARVIANELTRNASGEKQITVVVTDEHDNPSFEVNGVG